MFSADWLALREPADAAARSVRLARVLASVLPTDRLLRIVDLGAGTGANARALAEHLPLRQHWLLVDRDASLLDAVPKQMRSWATARGCKVTTARDALRIRGAHLDCRVTTRHGELAWAGTPAVRLPVTAPRAESRGEGVPSISALCNRCDLVTASALLDLVSEQWLQILAGQCARRGACVLFALTYDGRIACTPTEADDEAVRELVNRHQRTDKGFGPSIGLGGPAQALHELHRPGRIQRPTRRAVADGAAMQSRSELSPALGPDAAAAARSLLERAGYIVHTDASDWVLDSRFSELQRQLIDGWAHAALAIAAGAESTALAVPSDQALLIERWRARRLAHVEAGRSQIVVGHTDLVGWPTHSSRA